MRRSTPTSARWSRTPRSEGRRSEGSTPQADRVQVARDDDRIRDIADPHEKFFHFFTAACGGGIGFKVRRRHRHLPERRRQPRADRAVVGVDARVDRGAHVLEDVRRVLLRRREDEGVEGVLLEGVVDDFVQELLDPDPGRPVRRPPRIFAIDTNVRYQYGPPYTAADPSRAIRASGPRSTEAVP